MTFPEPPIATADAHPRSILWVAKFRPRTVADMILPVGLKRKFTAFVDNGDIPNLILCGPSGVGKTTAGRVMCDQLGAPLYEINSSLDRGIDMVRELENYASSSSLFAGGAKKYVLLDEFDNSTSDTKDALRGFIEKYEDGCGFILTCNYPDRISEALKSRCGETDFEAPFLAERDDLVVQQLQAVRRILDSEKVEYDETVIDAVVREYYPDFRRVLRELQGCSAAGRIDASTWMPPRSRPGGGVAPDRNASPGLLELISSKVVADDILADTDQSGPSVILMRASEITPEKIEWIWPGVIASGNITGIVGLPGAGKSSLVLDIAARVSTGGDWPGGAHNAKPGHVIVLSAEDKSSDTIVPRLIAAGADRECIQIVKAVKDDDGFERAFNLGSDLDRLEKEHNLQQVRLLIIDPASSYLGAKNGKSINRNHGGDVRAVQNRLGAFAARHQLAVLAISHLNKSSGARAITRIMGSLEWVAVPRAVFLVTEEAGTDRRLFLPLKNNLAPDRLGYAFRIDDRIVDDNIRTSALVWDPDPVTITAEEALAAATKKPTSGAVTFLQQALSDGPVDQTEIVRLGKEAGYTEKNLRTAREKLGVKPTRVGGIGAGGKWVWIPAAGATVLKLIVNNDPNISCEKASPSDQQTSTDANIPGVDKGAEPQEDREP